MLQKISQNYGGLMNFKINGFKSDKISSLFNLVYNRVGRCEEYFFTYNLKEKQTKIGQVTNNMYPCMLNSFIFCLSPLSTKIIHLCLIFKYF